MKNPFKSFKNKKADPSPAPAESAADTPETTAQPEPEPEAPREPEPAEPADSFEEWLRSRTSGGVERRERNDIFESYGVFGRDGDSLVYRLYHRYPEHEREFGLSYSRELSLDEFTARLLRELDKSTVSLKDCADCITKAEALKLKAEPIPDTAPRELTLADADAVKAFCESIDTLKDKTFSFNNGVFRFEGMSVAGGEELCLRFRRPLKRDAYDSPPAGVSRAGVYSYDIDDIWIMGICNRLREAGARLDISLLRSEWSVDGASVYLIRAEGFPDITGPLLIAAAQPPHILRFGFYSLDFSGK